MITVNISKEEYENFIEKVRLVVREELSSVRQEETSGKLYSPAEVCKIFQPAISKVTLHKWTKEGRIVSKKIGGRVWYRHSDLVLASSTINRRK